MLRFFAAHQRGGAATGEPPGQRCGPRWWPGCYDEVLGGGRQSEANRAEESFLPTSTRGSVKIMAMRVITPQLHEVHNNNFWSILLDSL
jgi:hypothetical protein